LNAIDNIQHSSRRVTGTAGTAVRGKGTERFEKDDDTSGSASRIDHQHRRRNNVRKDNLLEGIVRKSSHVVLYYYV